MIWAELCPVDKLWWNAIHWVHNVRRQEKSLWLAGSFFGCQSFLGIWSYHPLCSHHIGLCCLLLIEAWLSFQNHIQEHRLWKWKKFGSHFFYLLSCLVLPWVAFLPYRCTSNIHKQICPAFKDALCKRKLPTSWPYSISLQMASWRYKLYIKTPLLWIKNAARLWETKTW